MVVPRTVEGRLQARITKFALAQGCTVIRLHFGLGASAGWPDVLVLPQDRMPLFIEVKKPR